MFILPGLGTPKGSGGEELRGGLSAAVPPKSTPPKSMPGSAVASALPGPPPKGGGGQLASMGRIPGILGPQTLPTPPQPGHNE